MTLLDLAETVYRTMPGYRPEVVGGRLVVNPPADGRHADALTSLTLALAVLHGQETRLHQARGLWLPGGDDYVVPDLSIVDADYERHLVAFNCYAPHVFRLVVEITSSNHGSDTVDKPLAYARAGIPVYLIGDRRNRRVSLLTDPRDGEYRTRSTYLSGESFVLPESVGAKVELAADILLGPPA
ncbi:Uma2 family endonuclease [Streptomyces sp. NBRC 109706]|uniref:Uma2 family endonuclease n=1 Tax=Streptomyces sp. NBRC 109706 TaxID=1550035 RepID=UPI000AD258E4|nr:Uma2 family endonuclease [Streptomyces sp. NBRC 109706]